MHSNNQVDFPQRFAPEQRQMLFRRQAQPAVCHPNLPLTSCYAGRIPQMFSNRAMEKGKHKGEKKRLKILIRNWGPFFASSLTWNGNTLPIKKVAPEKREGGREREREQMKLDFQGQRKRSSLAAESWQLSLPHPRCLQNNELSLSVLWGNWAPDLQPKHVCWHKMAEGCL